MINHVIKTNPGGLYVSGKTKTVKGIRCEKLEEEGIRAKFYTSEKTAQKKVDKLNESGLYDYKFVLDKVHANVLSF